MRWESKCTRWLKMFKIGVSSESLETEYQVIWNCSEFTVSDYTLLDMSSEHESFENMQLI